MQSDWREVTLGDCVVINDATYSLRENWPFINYLDTSNITENRISQVQHLVAGEDRIPSRARRKVQPGDIVYSTVRPNQRHFGLVKEPPENFLVSTGFATIRGKEELALTEFVYWFLVQDHIVEYLHAIAEQNTSAYPSIKPSDIERLEIALPPFPEQRRIARTLGAIDDKIELNRRINATLESIARALYKSWFIDFDPVHAKMDGRWRRGESLPGMPAGLWDAFPARLVATEAGDAPEGWDVKKLGELVEFAYGRSLKAGNRRAGDIPVYGSNGQIGWHDEKLVDGPGVIVGRKGNPGIVTWSHTDFYPIDTTFYVKPKDEKISLYFLLYALQGQNLPSVAADSAVPGLNRNLAYMNRQLVPNTEIVDAYDQQMKALFAKMQRMEEETRTLAGLRDAMLPGLVMGERRT